MITHELLQVLGQLSQIYPHWRFGQLVANMAGVADVSLDESNDELLLKVAGQHLAKRAKALQLTSPQLSNGPPLLPERQELLQALRECYQQSPQRRLGILLSEAADQIRVNIFDVEDEQLLGAVKNLFLPEDLHTKRISLAGPDVPGIG